ncbi:MAG TPA: hypothetical protein VGQ72_10635 [Pyrinomonadaceae bacterium]|jgi:hypothetical protein|nr:hypothetical protein [Pyrinomonadaceae bacterium]
MPTIHISNHLSQSRRLVGLLILLAALGLSVGAFGLARGRNARVPLQSTEPTSLATSTTTSAQAISTTNALNVEHLTLRQTGFEPTEFTRPGGRFLLAIDNRAERGVMTFRILHESGTLERDLALKRGKFRLRQIVDLPVGSYLLTVTNHPEWVCRVTITAP